MRPYLRGDGGDLHFVAFDANRRTVRCATASKNEKSQVGLCADAQTRARQRAILDETTVEQTMRKEPIETRRHR